MLFKCKLFIDEARKKLSTCAYIASHCYHFFSNYIWEFDGTRFYNCIFISAPLKRVAIGFAALAGVVARCLRPLLLHFRWKTFILNWLRRCIKKFVM